MHSFTSVLVLGYYCELCLSNSNSHKRRNEITRNQVLASAAQCFGKTDQIVGDLFDARYDILVRDLIAIKGVPRCVNESGNNHGSKIKH